MAYENLTRKHLERLKSKIQDEMSSKNLDATGETSRSLEVQENKLLANESIYYLIYGRGPGKFPPPQTIKEWAQTKIGVDSDSVAYLIGRKIATFGTSIYNNRSLGIQFDELADEMLENITKELPDEAAAEVLKWV